MSLTITSRPTRQIETDLKSAWVAAGNPIRYRLALQDWPDNPDYRIEIELREWGTQALLAKARYLPKITQVAPTKLGELDIDISGFLRSYLSHQLHLQESDNLNRRDESAQVRAYLRFHEYYDGQIQTTQSDQANPIWAVAAVRQTGAPHEGNLADKLPAAVTRSTLPGFLSAFEKPVWFVGQPFSLSFLYPEILLGVEVTREQAWVDRNGVSLGTQNDLLDSDQMGGVNHLLLTAPSDPMATELRVRLSTGDITAQTYVYDGYVDAPYTESL